MAENKDFVEMMQIYSHHHSKNITKLTHFIGIPAIIVALQMALNWLHIDIFNYSIPFSWLILVLLLIYYFYLNARLAILSGIILAGLTLIAQTLATPHYHTSALIILLTLFIGGWILQFIGHFFEGNKPAFLVNLMQFLIAPLFLTKEIFGN